MPAIPTYIGLRVTRFGPDVTREAAPTSTGLTVVRCLRNSAIAPVMLHTDPARKIPASTLDAFVTGRPLPDRRWIASTAAAKGTGGKGKRDASLFGDASIITIPLVCPRWRSSPSSGTYLPCARGTEDIEDDNDLGDLVDEDDRRESEHTEERQLQRYRDDEQRQQDVLVDDLSSP